MAEFEEKLNSILSNPQMMQQIMSMAGSFNNQSQQPPPQAQPSIPFDPGTMQGMMELLRGTQLDSRQQGLVGALGAYLPQDKVIRLQKAMQASKVAKFAASALGKQHGG